MREAQRFYEKNINEGNNKLTDIKKVSLIFSSVRLIVVIACIITTYLLYKKGSYSSMFLSMLAYILIFIIVAYFHNLKLKERNRIELFVDINKKGLKRINGDWRDFKDNGEEFLSGSHGYINDLDIFGAGSLFQWINSARTKFGRKALANILMTNKLPNRDEILKRQEAIKELSKKIQWRQNLEIKSTFKKGCKEDVSQLIQWANTNKNIGLTLKVVPYICIILTTISVILVILRMIPFSFLILVFMINYLVVKLLTRTSVDAMNLFQKHKRDIEAYSNILSLIEDENFESELLIQLKNKLKNTKNISCKKEMKALKKLIDWIGDSASNPYYFLFNITILSDTFILRNLEEWKKRNGQYLEQWLELMGEFEALSSISNIAFDFTEWSYPRIVQDGGVSGEGIGHPMLGDKSRLNEFSLINKDKIALITGSNMSGKSTFLRTIGLNLLLSYMGAPTYSKKFSCGIYNMYTCMRTKDNLEENISSFYAEILRIKYLLEAAKEGEKVFFLLDELFKGTNSRDRHEGAKVLIEQLVNAGGIGLVSTHDLELCDLEKEKTWLSNYNFQEYYENGKIKFDYKLRLGRSTTTNAIHLMKLAGIQLR